MRTVNQTTLLGHATKDPETMTGYDEYYKLTMTTNSGWGEEKKAHHHSISIFDPKKTEFIMQYIKKGMIVFAQGELQYQEGKDGKWWTSITIGKYNGAVELCEKAPKQNIAGSYEAPAEKLEDLNEDGDLDERSIPF